MHPVISYVVEELDSAVVGQCVANISTLKIADLHKLCKDVEDENPSWNSELYMKDLRLLKCGCNVHVVGSIWYPQANWWRHRYVMVHVS